MSEPPVNIRPAKADDCDGVTALWSAAGLPASLRGRESREAFVEQLNGFRTSYLVAEVDGRIGGVVLGTHDRRKGWINRLAVHPRFRRRGIAARLISACEKALRAEGIDIIATLIEEGNEASICVFEHAGYRSDVPARYYRKRWREDI